MTCQSEMLEWGTSARKVRESHPGQPTGVVIYRLLGGQQSAGRGRRLSGAEIACIDGVSPTRDLYPQVVTGGEGVPDGPQGHCRRERPVRIAAHGCRVEALQSVAHVNGLAVW